MSLVKFNGQKISDQKRLVRGEQLLLARSCLRARDEVHHARWRVLTMAGGSPQGEMTAMRELMPKAYIVAVDRDAACLEAAIEAGADDVVHCDLTDWTQEPYMKDGWHPETGKYVYGAIPAVRTRPPAAISKHAYFDLINLDLCGGVNATAHEIVGHYRRLLATNGVMIVTFSYGRDVIEMFIAALAKFHNPRIEERFARHKLPDALAGRLIYLFTHTDLRNLASVMVYRGNEMPMCSCLVTNNKFVRDKFSYVQVARGDFELAVLHPDVTKLYDCPQERIAAMRRHRAAAKAVATRTERQALTDGTLFAELTE